MPHYMNDCIFYLVLWAFCGLVLLGVNGQLESVDTGDVTRCPPHLNRGGHLVVHGNRCYDFVTYSPLVWEDARLHCIHTQGRLVEIEDSSTPYFLSSYLSGLDDVTTGVWIGLQDKGHEGTWVWDSGSSSPYRHWASGYPGGLLGFWDDCALMKTDGYWYDYPCDTFYDYFAYICQYDIAHGHMDVVG